MNKILLIGCGHMGSAMLDAWIHKKNNKFIIIDPKNFKKINIKYKKRVNAYKSINDIQIMTKFDIIIFAVKPQSIINIMKSISLNKFNSSAVFISIIAGKKISFFEKYLKPKSQIVRIMPNLSSAFGNGFTAVAFNKFLLKKERSFKRGRNFLPRT